MPPVLLGTNRAFAQHRRFSAVGRHAVLPQAIEPNSHCTRSIIGALDFGKNALIDASHTLTVKAFIETLLQQGEGKGGMRERMKLVVTSILFSSPCEDEVAAIGFDSRRLRTMATIQDNVAEQITVLSKIARIMQPVSPKTAATNAAPTYPKMLTPSEKEMDAIALARNAFTTIKELPSPGRFINNPCR
jgi:hypothetical protein